MKSTILSLFSLCLFLNTVAAQDTTAVMDVHTFQQHKSEHTKPEKNKTTILISGVQADSVLNVKMVTTPEGIVELKINDVEIPADQISKHQRLTDFISDYAKMPRSKVAKPKTGPLKKPVAKSINDKITAELINDGFITEDTEVFDVIIAYKKMYFNGKEQPEDISKKYKTLYETHSGITLQPTTFYHFSQSLSDE